MGQDQFVAHALGPIGRIGRRERARALQNRMLAHHEIYNAAALLRDAWRGSEARRLECVAVLAEALALDLATVQDTESVLYAVADSLYCSPLGVPWEP